MNIETLTFNALSRGEPVTHTLRTTTINGERWFFAKDACLILRLHVRTSGEPNCAVALRYLDANEKRSIRVVLSGLPCGVLVVNDAGLYKLMARPNARSPYGFTRWVGRNVSAHVAAALAAERGPAFPAALRQRAAELVAMADVLDGAAQAQAA